MSKRRKKNKTAANDKNINNIEKNVISSSENTTSDSKIDQDALGFQVRESYKAARTNLVYSILKKGCKKIAFTSSNKGDGKTVTSTNIAIAFSEQVNSRVLVVECDLRRPRVHAVFGLKPELGITNYLNDECSLEDVICKTQYENLDAICFGAVPPNPSELLASNAMEEFISTVEKQYDYIIFDTPPVGVVLDAIPVIAQSDGVVLVVKHNSTMYPELKKTIETLEHSKAKILGIIMNDIEPIGSKKYSKYKKGYGYGYGYYGY